MRAIIKWLFIATLGQALSFTAQAEDWNPEPFSVRNFNPFILLHGLPVATSSGILEESESSLELLSSLANNSMERISGNEQVTLDGETYRLALIWKRGLGDGWQMGVEAPFLSHRHGVMDNLIENWHDLLGFSNSERDDWPRNRLRYLRKIDGEYDVLIEDDVSGFGDLQLLLSRRLRQDSAGIRVSMHASLKLPTGDSDSLLGSGATDLAVWLSGSDAELLKRWPVGGFFQAGLLYMGHAEVLREQQRNLALFGSLGLSWRAYDWLDLKLQLDGHTSFYHSDLDQLGGAAVMFTFGGSILFDDGPGRIDISLGENLTTDPVPDLIVNLAYKTSFP
ncbi:MAG: DUF3187 family protein [Candidatus Thiodiazotropha sp. (ex Epidulcina cf. delphinae)]|nr:DUF3187 family protein [Candidatus Thiodiazotropha sp. (ex Epidulcina cf. delphinae)]